MAHRFEEASSYVQDLIKMSQLHHRGPPDVYHLVTTQSNLNTDGKVRKWTFGQRNVTKPNKILLVVGETGTGKTSLINCLVNYTLGIKFEDGVWFEITEKRTLNPNEASDETISKTNDITVYEIFVEHSETSLTIIDTPGYGHTEGHEYDQQIAKNLYELFLHDTGVKEIDAVCLVVKASINRLSESQQYIFDAVLSLFGKDIEENIIVLATHSDGGPPTNVINAIKKAKIPYKENSKIYKFNNRQSESWNNCEDFYKDIWTKTEKNCEIFVKALDSLKRQSLKQTEDVLLECTQLKAILYNLHDRIDYTESKHSELNQIQEALKQNSEKINNDENFTFIVTKSYKEKVPIEKTTSWFHRKATCCSVCEQNCHEFNCWRAPNASWCEVMEGGLCTVCKKISGKNCHYSKHIKENKKYVTKEKTVEMTYADLKKHYESKNELINFNKEKYDEVREDHQKNKTDIEMKMSLENEVKADLEKTKLEKVRLVEEACISITRLFDIALKPDSAFIVETLDYLIPQAEEAEKKQWAEKLKELRKMEPEAQERAARRYLRMGYNKVTSYLPSKK